MSEKKIRSALISVFYKTNLEPIVKLLHAQGVKLISTGGTQSFIEALGIPVTPVEKLTGYPSILGGRVKTLHPKIFGGILGRRDFNSDQNEMHEFSIENIDLVIVDLYPFEETVLNTSIEEDIIEKIDIGGISLIRAAAKNFNDVLICASVNQYSELLQILSEQQGATTLLQRRKFAAHAFAVSSQYDAAIFNYFNRTENIASFRQPFDNGKILRYGENPHQQGIFFGDLNDLFEQLNGKELSYNNLVDLDAAMQLNAEFDEPTVCIVKHTNACGVASAETIFQAWKNALAADPVSAFGGVISANRQIDEQTASAINEIFFEILIAPSFTDEALAILKSKKNRMILQLKKNPTADIQFRSLLNGVLQQDKDLIDEQEWTIATTLQPTETQTAELKFANKIVKHLKSNTIVLVSGKQLLGMGCGQTSRVDALKQAISKAQSFGFNLSGAAMASDAFFPFPDCVQIAHEAGIASVIQPGGSIKDKDSIDYCNQNKMAMVITGTRHFKH